MMQRTEIVNILKQSPQEQPFLVKGWVRAFRSNRFIALNDGSTPETLQIVVDYAGFPEALLKKIQFHACIAVTGKLVKSQGAGQEVELVAESIEILGEIDPEAYPLKRSRQAQTMEHLREHAHLRMRTNVFGAVFRIRHALAFAVHRYFHDRGYVYLHTPVITGSDAEGAGEMFRVTTLPPQTPPTQEDGQPDWGQDFFGIPTHLTVSGQLQAEVGALALGKVYTFGPTFRAENSNTKRHLAEFWMIEPEVAFCDLNEDMDIAEDFLKALIRDALETCPQDLQLLDARITEQEKHLKAEQRRPMSLLDTLHFVLEHDFARIS
ncbi:MAG: amino acid--tRNA ligase-related protein, partial [Myxococcota bacterium]